MTRTSFITVAIALACGTVCCEDDQKLTILSVPEVVQNEANRRSIDRIRFEGNTTYSAQSIRNAFNRSEEIHGHLWPKQIADKEWTGTTWQQFTNAVKDQVLIGYHQSGFLDAQVTINSDDKHPVIVVINEGSVFNANKIVIDGATAEVAARIREVLATQPDELGDSLAGIFRVDSTSGAVWQQGKPASTSPRSQQQIQDCVNAAMHEYGYRFAESALEFEADRKQSTVDLHITINSRQQNPVGEITFSGLKAYSDSDVRQIINIESGIPASPQLCRKVEAALVNSGRFLFAECSTDTPFGAEQPVDVHVRVGEYSEIAPDDPLTEVHQGILRYAQWLNSWPQGDQDFVIDASFDVQKCLAASPQPGTAWMDSVSSSLGAWLRTVEIRLVVSPQDGMILKVKAETTNGDLLINHSFVEARNVCGVFSHRHHRKWMAEGDYSTIGTRILEFSFRGQDPTLSDRRLQMNYKFGAKSKGVGQIGSKFNIQPTALLCSLTSRFLSSGEPVTTPTAVVAVNEDGRKVVRSHGVVFAVETEAESGQLLSAKINHPGLQCVVRVDSGQLQQELAKLQQDSKDDENYFEVDNGLSTAMRFVAAEFEELPDTKQPALLKLAVSLLNDPDTQVAAKSWMDELQTTERFPLPAPDTSISIPIWLIPQDQVLRQVMQVVFVSKAVQSAAQLRSITINAMSREEFGPVSCALLASRFRQLGLSPFAKALAVLGHRRLTTAGLLNELEPLLRPSTVIGAIAHCLVKDVQELDEEEFEALVAAAQQIKWNFGGTQVDISAATLRQLLTTMHIHGSHDSAIVLRDSLTMLCESKTEDLRKFLAAQLQPITPDRSLFRAASAKKDGSKSKSKVRPMYQPAPRPAEDIDPKPQP